MSGLAAIMLAYIAAVAGHGIQHALYDADVPARCETFDKATAPQNEKFCNDWFKEHRR